VGGAEGARGRARTQGGTSGDTAPQSPEPATTEPRQPAVRGASPPDTPPEGGVRIARAKTSKASGARQARAS